MAGPRHARADGGGWRPIGEVADVVVRETGRRAIAVRLERAAGSGGREALAAFKKADRIRRRLGLSWARLICPRLDGGNGDAPR